MSGDVWLVIPTYNEAENVEAIVAAADEQLTLVTGDAHRILVVDDNSPDGTGVLADAIAARNAAVEVLHRAGKGGLGQAYLAGFAHALARGAEIVMQMDADFSHDPGYLPTLLAATETSDLVIGSRYVRGGGTSDWGPLRRAISRGGGIYSRAVLGLRVRDLTGGFKAIHRRVLETIDLPTIQAEGYVFQIEVTYRAVKAGFTVAEVPIVFRDRTAGSSKMSSRIALEAMLRVPALRRELRAAAPSAPAGERVVGDRSIALT